MNKNDMLEYMKKRETLQSENLKHIKRLKLDAIFARQLFTNGVINIAGIKYFYDSIHNRFVSVEEVTSKDNITYDKITFYDELLIKA